MSTLVCFAMPEEAGPFQRKLARAGGRDVRVVVTGMGRENSLRAVEQALPKPGAERVITCGFAGGLDPALPTGTVLYQATGCEDLARRLEASGVRPGRIACVDRVAVTVADKARVRAETGAVAVEMESGHLATWCEQKGRPCAIVRVILDPATEDLPLDFNAIMTPGKKIHLGKLAWWIATHPGRIPGLTRLQTQTKRAAERLAGVLEQALLVGP